MQDAMGGLWINERSIPPDSFQQQIHRLLGRHVALRRRTEGSQKFEERYWAFARINRMLTTEQTPNNGVRLRRFQQRHIGVAACVPTPRALALRIASFSNRPRCLD
jgi:hypothetical protein